MNTTPIPNAFYRVSIKGLIFDESRKKFIIIKENNGWWELPGGGLDWGESPIEGLKREIKEEMGLIVTEIAKAPSYCLIGKNMSDDWNINLVYEIKVQDFNFIPTDECVEMKFVTPEEAKSMHSWRNVKELADLLVEVISL